MFLRTYNKANYYEIAAHNTFQYYKADIMALHTQQWKEEDVQGESCVQFKTMQYYAAIYYISILSSILNGGIKTWDEIKTKYCYEDKRKKFACNGIDLDRVAGFFSLPPNGECGINGMGIQDTFEIEPIISPCEGGTINCSGGIDSMGIEIDLEVEPLEFSESCPELTSINIEETLANLYSCTVNIETVCPCIC